MPKTNLRWQALQDGKQIAGEIRPLKIPLGGHATVEIAFVPRTPGELILELVSAKNGKEQFQDRRLFLGE